MTATANTAAQPTERQLRFFNDLAAERGIPAIEHFAPGTTRRQASEAIDGMLALPRVQQPRQPRQQRDDRETVPTPSADTRAGRMLLAGGIEATVTLADGRHCTIEVRTRGRRGNGWTNMAPGEEGARTNVKILGSKVGWINIVDGEWKITLRTRRAEYHTAIQALFEYAAGQPTPGERVQEASRCGRCFRQLTDPVSIDRGIGPECFGRDTGSQHIAADRDRQGTSLRATRAATVDEATAAANAARDRALRAGAHPDQADGDAFGAYEAVQERRAYEREMAEERSLVDYAAGLAPVQPRRADDRRGQAVTAAPIPAAPTVSPDVRRARDIIAEALDLADVDAADAAFALRIFDSMKAQA